MNKTPELIDVLKKQFPNVEINGGPKELKVNSFIEWDSMAHFTFLMLVEETYNIRFMVDEMTELKSLEDIQLSLLSKGVPLP